MRNTIWKFTVAAVLVVAATSMAFAQGGGGGGRGGAGGFGGGQGRGGMFGNDTSGLNLLGRADVQKDLNITAEQKTKIDALNQANRDKMRSAFQDNQGDQEGMMKAMEKIQADNKAEVAKILDAKQVKRLGEIRIQLAGNRAIMEADVQKALGMSAEQVAKVKKLSDDSTAAMRSLGEKMMNQEISREDMQAAMQKNNETMNAELGKVLTADQTAKLKTMGGEPFKAEPQQGRGGGAGGRGGGTGGAGGGGGRGGGTGGGGGIG
ncbi:MAG: Spy/CpxP family protein refolding chaperone [Fimbriimonadaceae bacterium]|nr:Spy/CpxP family protein refolding chaperone [Fimbriimonadaceae bacterium]